MIPLWLTIPCSIILLAIILRNLLTSDINWKVTVAVVKAVAMTIITIICVVVVILSICQWLPC